jgi:two-component system NtrC family sensor kinase
MTLAAGDPLAPTRPLPPIPAPPVSAFVALADAIGDGLVAVDDAGTVRALNASGEALLPLVGGRSGGLAPVELFDALSDSRASGKPVVREVVARSPASRHVRIAALALEGQRIVALRESTEERLLQERLLQSEKMASVGQLVSGVAHELNNPLTGVMGFAQLLLARDLDEASRQQVRTIYGEAERAAKIVQNLLSFARRRKPAKEMADVNALLAQVLELRSYDFAIRNISLDMELDPRMPRCWVDADQVQQVFFNVVKNAEQAMIDAHGGGRLTVRTQGPQGESGSSGAAVVRITVADDGPGIAPEVARRIFDPFFTTKEAGQGTGLGLTISYGIIDEHGGRLWAEPRTEGGTAFVIELPLAGPSASQSAVDAPRTGGQGAVAPQPEANEGGQASRGEETASQQAGTGPHAPAFTRPSYRVLVVDDEESIRLLLRDILEMEGHRVEVATSGIDAWSHLDGEGGPPELIITDMKMPGMDGATFFKEVSRRDPALARRIIFITGDTVSPDTRAFLQDVTNPVLSKPFKIGPLRDAMEELMGARQKA